MFLEKNKLKDDSSNDADWIRDLRIILVVAQKNYVLDAPLGDRPIAGADADVMNVWLAQYDNYLTAQNQDFKDILNVMDHMICSRS